MRSSYCRAFANRRGPWRKVIGLCISVATSLLPDYGMAGTEFRDGGPPSATAPAMHVGPFTFYGRSIPNDTEYLPQPRFPAELMATSVTEGYALVAWTIQPDGRVDDALVVDTSDCAFGESALRALPRRLLPQRDPDAMPRYQMARFLFKRKHAVVTATAYEYLSQQARPMRYAGHSIDTVQPDALDAEVTLVDGQSGDSSVLRTGGTAGTVTIRFYIDQHGAVRVPSIMAASSAQSALTALAAIKQWRFNPPTVAGNPVQVEAVRTVYLGVNSRTAEAASTTSPMVRDQF
jgi:TonB family protein